MLFSFLFFLTIIAGQLDISSGHSSRALVSFLKAAKLNPLSPLPFLYLGHHYVKAGDWEKARKCYQKSFKLDPTSEEAGAALSDVYRIQVLTLNNY